MKPGRRSKGTVYSASSLERALSILEVFSPSQPSLSLADIVKTTGLNKTTAFRLLTVLGQRGFVMRDSETGEYAVGFRALALGEACRKQMSLIRSARPLLRSIRDLVNETTFLTIRWGDCRVDLEQAESSHPLRQVMAAGRPKPLYVGASGKALLAGLPQEELEDYLDRVPRTAFSPTTIVDRAALFSAVEQARRQGYAESLSEAGTGVAGVAALVRGNRDMPLAVLVVATPMQRFSPELRERAIAILVEKAAELSARLGGAASDQSGRAATMVGDGHRFHQIGQVV